jgi:hypothetical protein
MVFPIAGGNESKGYDVENSLRFNDGDSPQLSLSTGTTNKRKFTVSVWVKRTTNGARQVIWSSDKQTNDTGDGSKGGSGIGLQFWNDDQFYFGGFGGSFQIRADGLQRDNSAWYHIVGQVDTEQSTTNDRAKLWINGVQQTTYTSMIGQNTDVKFAINRIGVKSETANYSDSDSLLSYLDGYVAELHVIDGQYYDATYFGEFDNNGVWIPKKYTGSYGSDGYYLEFKQTGTSQNSSGIGADTSGNDNHFAVTNLAALDVTEDTCTNNFATLNPLSDLNITFSEGNVEGIRTASSAAAAVSTIAPSSGKWYFEFKNTGAQNSAIGVVNLDDWPSTTDIYDYSAAAAVLVESNANYNVTYGNTASSPTTLQNSTDLVTAKYGLAMDIDNNDLYVSANGNWYGGSSFNQSDFSNATAVSTDLPSNVPLAFFVRGSLANTFYVNFGNPGGDDTISSGNNDGKYGNFEYAVPSGYYALCTKRLAEFG